MKAVTGNFQIQRMVLFFKMDEHERIWFLFATQMKQHPTPAQIKAAAPARTGVRKREACFLACRMSSVVGVMI